MINMTNQPTTPTQAAETVVYVEREERSKGSIYAENFDGDTMFLTPVAAGSVRNEPSFRLVSGQEMVSAAWIALAGDLLEAQFVRI